MKKVLSGLCVCILSLIITFVTFELMSCYHFGDIPTKVVTLRLIVFFIFITIILIGIIILVKKRKNNFII